MLLGIISFSLFLVETAACLKALPAPSCWRAPRPCASLVSPATPARRLSAIRCSSQPEILHELHIIHLALFYISLCFICEALFILYMAETVARRWTVCEKMNVMAYAKLKVEVSDMQVKQVPTNLSTL